MLLCKFFILLFSVQILFSCEYQNVDIPFQKQHYFYSNHQGNNTIEGDHLYINKIKKDTVFFDHSFLKILKNIDKNWIIGQGSGKAYFDTGKEYFWFIKDIIKPKNAIVIKRPKGLKQDLPIVFWKCGPYPSKFSNTLNFSWGFSKIIFNQKDSIYRTHIYECDTDSVNLYLATSKNSFNWDIKHLLSPKDFKNVSWNVPAEDGTMKVTPLISEVINYNEKFFSFAYGDDATMKTYIGLLISDSLDGKYKIIDKPLLSPDSNSYFSNNDVYHPKVVKTDSCWMMFYTAKNIKKEAYTCVAKSNDLISWNVLKENIIPRNKGWNSALFNQLCAQVKIKNDTLFLWSTGAKDVGDYKNPNKGNAMDACIGKFYTLLPKIDFKECPGNPVFGGNPIFESENDHVGAAFQEIIIDGYKTTFYHAKGSSTRKYTIFVR